MQIVDSRCSRDGKARVLIYRRDDGMFSFEAAHLVSDGDGATWKRDTSHVSLFDSLELALQWVEESIGWLARELAWPARDAPVRKIAVAEDLYLRCPFCNRVFSLADTNRWGGGTHLSCRQRIDIVAATPPR